MNLMHIGKEIFLTALASLPPCGGIARQWDSIETKQRFKKIEGEIRQIWKSIQRNPASPLEGPIRKFTRLIEDNNLMPDFNFRKAESCMILLREISNNSKFGQSNDPLIKYDRCIRIVKNNINTVDLEKELKLVVYELEREDLIFKHASMNSPLGFHAISPKEYFFCRTDSIFQEWSPKHDAKEIVKLLIDGKHDSIAVEKLDVQLKWGPRRLNSAIAFLHLNKLIHKDHDLGGIEYILQWIRLEEETYFFIKSI